MSAPGGTELAADAAAAGFGHRIGWGERPALLLVDVVRAYATPGSPLDLGRAAAGPVIAACARLLAAAREGGRPAVHTVVRHAAGSVDAGLFVRKVESLRVFAADSAQPELGEIVPELAPRAGEPVIVKQYASAFFGTSLASTLTALGVDTVVVAGMSTSGCVRASAVDALQHGFRPMVVREACGDRHRAVQEANLFDLDAKYADVVGETEALPRLARRDHHGGGRVG